MKQCKTGTLLNTGEKMEFINEQEQSNAKTVFIKRRSHSYSIGVRGKYSVEEFQVFRNDFGDKLNA